MIPEGVFAQLEQVRTFGYQLQNIDLSHIRASPFDLVILDYSADGSETAEFTTMQIESVKTSGKLVVAYLSIGEAETYRFYWQDFWDRDRNGTPDPDAPEWLDSENTEWEGNYKVHYWHPDWHALIFSYLDRIIAAGFDGVYLDIVDAYYFYQEQGRQTAAAEMIDFVIAIADHARQKQPGFLVIPQNGAYIIWDVDNQAKYQQYLTVIDGIGNESVFFRGTNDKDNPLAPDKNLLNVLSNDYKAQGKPVFIIEYVTQTKKKARLLHECKQRGFVPYATFRALDRLPAFP